MAYKYKVDIPEELRGAGYGRDDMGGGLQVDMDKLRANPSKYADYISQRLSQDDFDPMASDPGQYMHTNENINGGTKDMFSEYSRQAYPGVQKQLAADIRSPGSQNEIFGNYRNQVLGDLAQNQRMTGKNLQRRGISFGGVAQGAQTRLNAGASRDLAIGKQDISSQAEAEARDVEANAMNYGIQQRNLQQQHYNTVYNSALQSYITRKAGNAALAKGIGTVGGAVLGGYFGGPAGAVGGGVAGGAVGGAVGENI